MQKCDFTKKKILWSIFFTLFKLREIIFQIAMPATYYMQTNFLLDLIIVPKTNFFGKLIFYGSTTCTKYKCNSSRKTYILNYHISWNQFLLNHMVWRQVISWSHELLERKRVSKFLHFPHCATQFLFYIWALSVRLGALIIRKGFY